MHIENPDKDHCRKECDIDEFHARQSKILAKIPYYLPLSSCRSFKLGFLVVKKGMIACQHQDENGRSGKLWRVEARYKKVSISEAVREMKRSTENCKCQNFNKRFTYRFLSIPSGHQVTISEYDVSIRKRPGGRLEGKAVQLFSWFVGESSGTIIFRQNY